MKEKTATATLDGFEVRYYKTTHMSEDGEKFYGIHAAKYVKEVFVEENETGAMSSDEKYVEDMIKMLAENEVTPYVLCEIMDEIGA